LVDLLSEDEKKTDLLYKNHRFDIDLLTQRVLAVSEWIMRNPKTRDLQIGYFASSTGAVAALSASVRFNNVNTIITKSARMDLLDDSIRYSLKIPVLLIVGGWDSSIVKMNKRIYDDLKGAQKIKFTTIAYASHFFDEEGKLDEVFAISQSWYKRYLLNEKQRFRFHLNDLHSHFKSILEISNRFVFKFRDRSSAGFVLANLLKKYEKDPEVIVIGIPKGGMVVADAVAKCLSITNLDFVLSRRIIGQHSEDTVGATIEDGSVYVYRSNTLSKEYVDQVSRENEVINTSLRSYGSKHFPSKWKDKKLILVDDGAFTGSSIILAHEYLKKFNPSEVIIALPVLAKEAYDLLLKETNNIVFIYKPKNFNFVGNYYKKYDQVDESTVIRILKQYY